MRETGLDKNYVTVKGKLTGGVTYSHDFERKGFYITYLSVERKSRVPDRIPLIVPESIMTKAWRKEGQAVEVLGEYRSYDHYENEKLKLELTVYVKEYHFIRKELEPVSLNQVVLEGNLCKRPVYRTTPAGREITDLLVAVNRDYRKADYIPCICWGRNARRMRRRKTGTRVRLKGRIQSRTYIKHERDGKDRRLVAYEVSVSKIEFIDMKSKE